MTRRTYLTSKQTYDLMKDGCKAVSYARQIRCGARVYRPNVPGSAKDVHTNTLKMLLGIGAIRVETHTDSETVYVSASVD